MRIPILSPIAGIENDGVVRGKINQSLPVAGLIGRSLVEIVQVLRKDVNTTGQTWVDVTTIATDSTVGDFFPFGVAGNMSNGDAFYVRTVGDVDVHVFYVQVSTPGVGSWGVDIQEWNITTDQWESVIGLVDTSSGFKAGTGVYKLSYTSGPEGKVRLDDTSPKYVWHKITLVNLISVTTAPVLSRIWSADSPLSYSNITAIHTSSPADFSTLPTEILPRVGECVVLVHPGLPMGEDVTITRSASANYTTQRQYLASDGIYKSLMDVSDPSNGYTASPSTTPYKVRWTPPSDWVSKTIIDSAGVVHTGWIECLRITTIVIEGPVAPPQIQSRSRAFGSGNASGVYHRVATTYYGIVFFNSIPALIETKLSFINANTGIGQTVTIPANIGASSDLATRRLDFSAPLSMGAGESMLVACISGGTIQDMEIFLI